MMPKREVRRAEFDTLAGRVEKLEDKAFLVIKREPAQGQPVDGQGTEELRATLAVMSERKKFEKDPGREQTP